MELTDENLKKMYLDDARSVNSIAKEFGLDFKTMQRKLLELHIPLRTQKEQQRLYLDGLYGPKIVESAQVEVDSETSRVERGDIVSGPSQTPNIAYSIAQPLGYSLASPANTEDYVESAYSRLSKNQKAAIDLMAQFDAKFTNESICESVGISTTTLRDWKTQPDFQRALDEAQKPNFISELKSLSRQDLMDRFKDGKTTKEDRMVAFKITGDLGADNINNTALQVNIKGDW